MTERMTDARLEEIVRIWTGYMPALDELLAEVFRLRAELTTTDALLNERQRLLDAVPECKDHGKCVPHAIEWVEGAKACLAVYEPEE